ncbi:MULTISPECIES: hydroxyethylthiazole kinase [unclassified Acinetobacter]|uniref:hydroxyethylthiazole kinase n=1 Tax=unclassified Acinetobacter TaxID=196816 RepID=UPI002934D579|nr:MULTISPECIES: hydroxyethylthiazole kinase [unclassified Acinetobacter]WOE32103.1 hydroxyethylthiazole kinase [Acinetobacter sp. SAAs470]WOE37572.1 hydroxyethylthiazole kinase [Acinetobacter sp. SAAs474]
MSSSDSTQIKMITAEVIEAWQALQQQHPLIHCITNTVAANYTANILLAAGASPAMIDNPFEAGHFIHAAHALSINTGTPTTEQIQAMKIAAKAAQQNQKPWVLDPVGYSTILAWRSQTIDELITLQPSVIRGNASEICALAGHQIQSKGVDSTLNSTDVYQQAKVLLQYSPCIAISGEADFILSKAMNNVIKINGGSFLQPKITATGCALGALIAAYTAVTNTTIATIAAHVHFSIAGQLAFEKFQTVGHFNVEFLDQIYCLNPTKIEQYINIEILE